MLLIYPQYNDLLNGFTYNGHAYITAFVLLSIAISLVLSAVFYQKLTMNHILHLFYGCYQRYHSIAYQGGILIIPVYCGLLAAVLSSLKII
jgi:hypothetical protein